MIEYIYIILNDKKSINLNSSILICIFINIKNELFMENFDNNDVLFYITKDQVQEAAIERYGHSLSDEDFEIVKDGLEWGIMSSIENVYSAVFDRLDENKGK